MHDTEGLLSALEHFYSSIRSASKDKEFLSGLLVTMTCTMCISLRRHSANEFDPRWPLLSLMMGSVCAGQLIHVHHVYSSKADCPLIILVHYVYSAMRTLRIFKFYGFLPIKYGYIDYFLIRISPAFTKPLQSAIFNVFTKQLFWELVHNAGRCIWGPSYCCQIPSGIVAISWIQVIYGF